MTLPQVWSNFDGWTPPMINGDRSDYHRAEVPKDNGVIQEIIKI